MTAGSLGQTSMSPSTGHRTRWGPKGGVMLSSFYLGYTELYRLSYPCFARIYGVILSYPISSEGYTDRPYIECLLLPQCWYPHTDIQSYTENYQSSLHSQYGLYRVIQGTCITLYIMVLGIYSRTRSVTA